MVRILLILFIANFSIFINGATVNTEVQRVLDLTSPVIKMTVDVKATGIDKEYQISFPDSHAAHLAYLSVNKKGGPKLPITAPVTFGNFTYYNVEIKESSATLKIIAVFTNILSPFPVEIGQHDNQLVLYTENHFFFSPYKTDSQKTTVKLTSSMIESYTKLDPVSARGSTIVFGTYKDIQPFQESPLTIHYVNNRPFSKFATVARELEVSHWGNIAIEEVYELQHAGARLKDGFSRVEYMMKRSQDSPSFRGLVAVLPVQANNIYYRDQIGNISTSDMQFDNGALELVIETRFPMFGGWQTQFYLGYSIPTEVALFIDGEGRHQLKFDFFTVFKDVWIEDLEIKVVLPEGCADIQVNVPYAVEQSWTKRYTFLDSRANGGRPVLTLKAKNIVADHDAKVNISYTFNRSRMIVEPLMLIGSFFFLFVCCSVFVRLDALLGITSNTSKKVVVSVTESNGEKK